MIFALALQIPDHRKIAAHTALCSDVATQDSDRSGRYLDLGAQSISGLSVLYLFIVIDER